MPVSLSHGLEDPELSWGVWLSADTLKHTHTLTTVSFAKDEAGNTNAMWSMQVQNTPR